MYLITLTSLIRWQWYKRIEVVLVLHSSLRATTLTTTTISSLSSTSSIVNLFIMDLCISCKSTVRPRQEGLQCDECFDNDEISLNLVRYITSIFRPYRWLHHKCQTGISQAQYRAAVQSQVPIDWWCDSCRPAPVLESTRQDDELNSTIYDPFVVSKFLSMCIGGKSKGRFFAFSKFVGSVCHCVNTCLNFFKVELKVAP